MNNVSKLLIVAGAIALAACADSAPTSVRPSTVRSNECRSGWVITSGRDGSVDSTYTGCQGDQ